MPKVVYRITSPRNITFDHEVAVYDTGTLSDEWDDLTDEEKDDLIYDPMLLDEMVWGSVEIYALVVED